jgi:hypothetical protein
MESSRVLLRPILLLPIVEYPAVKDSRRSPAMYGLRARLKTGGAAAGGDRPDVPGQSAACRWCDMRGPW